MKIIFALLQLAAALSLRAADTNAPAAKETNLFAKIPDASHAPVRVTNAVTIAGERVSYIAETGMLPLLKADGTARASPPTSATGDGVAAAHSWASAAGE